MRYELEADQWHFILELERTPNYRPDNKFIQTPPDDLKQLREGTMAFFSIIITSSKIGAPEENLTHYACGLLLPLDPDELQEDLEIVLDDEGLLEHVLNHWELQESCEGPSWRQG